MKTSTRSLFKLLLVCLIYQQGLSQTGSIPSDIWSNPPEDSKPWTFWYWMHGALSKAGITADIEAMSHAGLGGAYLMPIKGPLNPPHLPNAVSN